MSASKHASDGVQILTSNAGKVVKLLTKRQPCRETASNMHTAKRRLCVEGGMEGDIPYQHSAYTWHLLDLCSTRTHQGQGSGAVPAA